jgi:hypothetical protein
MGARNRVGIGLLYRPAGLHRLPELIPGLHKRLKIWAQGCRVDVSMTDVSPTESSWMLRPLNKASFGYCAPDQCVPTLDCVTHGSHKAGSTAAIRLPITDKTDLT